MLNVTRREDPKLPKVTPMPTPPRMPNAKAPAPEYYDPEVLRLLQADHDRRRKISELETECDDWRRQALDYKKEIERLEMLRSREQKEHDEAQRAERAEHDDIIGKLMLERDALKAEVVRIRTCAQNGATVFLQILDDSNRPREITPADKAGLAAVADALSAGADGDFREGEGAPIPRVVTAGPRDYPAKEGEGHA